MRLKEPSEPLEGAVMSEAGCKRTRAGDTAPAQRQRSGQYTGYNIPIFQAERYQALLCQTDRIVQLRGDVCLLQPDPFQRMHSDFKPSRGILFALTVFCSHSQASFLF